MKKTSSYGRESGGKCILLYPLWEQKEEAESIVNKYNISRRQKKKQAEMYERVRYGL